MAEPAQRADRHAHSEAGAGLAALTDPADIIDGQREVGGKIAVVDSGRPPIERSPVDLGEEPCRHRRYETSKTASTAASRSASDGRL